ncbi:MAG TPA: cupin domain-containing protein [Candidatus Nitrosotenuis sp.]|jgi:mannose-6-phosphate isomerase-like protein (cupin superfamily)
MIISDLNKCTPIPGSEGTKIRQIFHPHNTMLGIGYSVSQCTVEPGKSSKPHKLKSSEIYFVLKGRGILHIDDESSDIIESQAAYVPPSSRQFIENTGNVDLEFLCIVEPAWKQEDEIIE